MGEVLGRGFSKTCRVDGHSLTTIEKSNPKGLWMLPRKSQSSPWSIPQPFETICSKVIIPWPSSPGVFEKSAQRVRVVPSPPHPLALPQTFSFPALIK